MKKLLSSIFVIFLLLIFGSSQPAGAITIGPDAFGYTARDVASDFEDISSSGNLLPLSGDDSYISITLPFSFEFYGNVYASFAATNGYITFGQGATTYSNQDFSTSIAPNAGQDLPMIAPFWDDIVVDPSAAVYDQTLGPLGDQQYIIQWDNVRFFADSERRIDFQVILFEGSNDILFQYDGLAEGDSREQGGSATVGIRNTNGQNSGEFLQWSYNTASLSDEQAILFSASVPEPATMLLLGSGLIALAGLRRKLKK